MTNDHENESNSIMKMNELFESDSNNVFAIKIREMQVQMQKDYLEWLRGQLENIPGITNVFVSDPKYDDFHMINVNFRFETVYYFSGSLSHSGNSIHGLIIYDPEKIIPDSLRDDLDPFFNGINNLAHKNKLKKVLMPSTQKLNSLLANLKKASRLVLKAEESW